MRKYADRNERPQKDAIGHHGSEPPLSLQASSVGPLLAHDATLLAVLSRRIHHRVRADRRRRPLHPPSSTFRRTSAARLRTTPADAAAARARSAPHGRRRRRVGRAGSRRRRLTLRVRPLQLLRILAGREGDEAGVRLALRETVGREESGREVDGPGGTALRCVLLGVDVGYDDCHDESDRHHQHR